MPVTAYSLFCTELFSFLLLFPDRKIWHVTIQGFASHLLKKQQWRTTAEYVCACIGRHWIVMVVKMLKDQPGKLQRKYLWLRKWSWEEVYNNLPSYLAETVGASAQGGQPPRVCVLMLLKSHTWKRATVRQNSAYAEVLCVKSSTLHKEVQIWYLLELQ